MGTVAHQHGALRENVVDALRADIVTGRLAPGEPLRTEIVMQRFGVSNSPLREAFAQLASEGLVVVQRNRGATVAPITRDAAVDVFRVGGLLLEHVLRWGLPDFVSADVAALRRSALDFELAFRSGDLTTAFSDCDRFNQLLFERCGSPELARAALSLQPRLQRVVRLLDPVDYLALQGSQQKAVLASADDRDVESAVAAIRSIWRQVERMVQVLPDDTFHG